jgi:hypothetical protein
MKAIFTKDQFCNFVPVDKDDIRSIPTGTLIEVSYKKPSPEKTRSYLQLKTYHKCLKTTAGNLKDREPNWNTKEKIDLICKIKCGFIKDTIVVDMPCISCNNVLPQAFFIPDSLSYGNCGHGRACKYISDAIELMAKKLETTPQLLIEYSD